MMLICLALGMVEVSSLTGLWYVGVIMSIVASISSNLGVKRSKVLYDERQKDA